MKKIMLPLLTVISAIMLNCSNIGEKIVNNTVDKLKPTFSFTAITSYADTMNIETHTTNASHIDGNKLFVIGDEDSIMISLTFTNPAIGKYKIKDSTYIATFQVGESLNLFLADSGEIEITELRNTNVAVQFNFVAKNALGQTVTVTNGKGNLIPIIQ